jgi:MFS family permease
VSNRSDDTAVGVSLRLPTTPHKPVPMSSDRPPPRPLTTAATADRPAPFFGPSVVAAAFVMAVFGWGVGVYGPPVFMHAAMQRTGWSLAFVSSAVTLHYLFGACVVAQLPRLHRRFGVGPTATAGAALALAGMLGWAAAAQPWQLMLAACASGSGWVTMGAVAVNAVVAPWYVRRRPMALSQAYNGASLGGVIFAPLWVFLIGWLGFVGAALTVGLSMLVVVSLLSHRVFVHTPQARGQWPDGDRGPVDTGDTTVRATATWVATATSTSTSTPTATATAPTTAPAATLSPLPGRQLWAHPRFVTLALAMAAGLFAQIGLIAHLFSLLVPAFGSLHAGVAMGLATACAIGGRMLVARLLPPGVDRRWIAIAAYGVQVLGTLVLMVCGETQVGWMLLGVLLFGSGIGNATSLPPLIAQAEFNRVDQQRVVALIVALSQATYAFAPAAFGLVLAMAGVAPRIGAGAAGFFVAVGLVQMLAMFSLWAGRARAVTRP